jgi:outer membrane protein OmpA-like peptidoglycan-associated protein/opacity protein-like surface antigen
MKRHGWQVGLAALGCALGWSTTVAAHDGVYLGLEAGANFATKEKYDLYGFDPVLGGVADGTRVGETEFKTGFLGGLVVGYGASGGLRPELEVSFRSNKFDRGKARQGSLLDPPALEKAEGLKGKTDVSAAFLNLWYDFSKGGTVHPYLGGGAGYSKVDIKNPRYDTSEPGYKGDDDKLFVWQAGVGVGFDLSTNLQASFDVRYVRSDKGKFDLLANSPNSHVETRYEAISAIAGLKYFFGAEPPPPPPAEPVAVVPPAAICNDTQDNDGDGKTDFPADPGCTSADDSDETDPPPPPPPPCKTPAPGERVSLAGCGTGDTIVLRGVNFDFDKSNLTVNAKTILDNVAEELAKYPDIKVEVGGHTDAKGSDEYNQKLSDRRAASVVKYLEGKGVAADRMTSVGYGETKPVADNETDEGRELNRRVELKITAGVAGASAATPVAEGTAVTPDAAVEAAPAEAAPATP